jgi:O-acetyl-ADP-ribose deacetylase (regulator of RNase III)
VGVFIPQDSVVSQCTAIGTTSKGDEAWPGFPARVECVGIPPYPGLVYPRVIALAVPKKHRVSATNRITSLRGDATEPRGNGLRIVAHVVNDKAATWGAGFARVVGRKWPLVQEDFKIWAETHLRLGAAHLTAISDDVAVFHMVAQRGYGPSPKPRIRYGALSACLRVLADVASDRGASVHIPRIGCGQAGGDWAVVSELIDEHLCRRGVAVSVYDLPGVEFSDHAQRSLPFRDV